MRKISCVLAGIVLATFAIGRVDSLAAHRGFGGSIVWAQSWDDLSHDAAPQSGDSEPQTAPPNIAGTWAGTLHDHLLGQGNLSFSIHQNGSKVSGRYSSDFGGGKLRGKIHSDGSIVVTLHIISTCGLAAHAMVVGNEITGTYHAAGCTRNDHGSFQVFFQ